MSTTVQTAIHAAAACVLMGMQECRMLTLSPTASLQSTLSAAVSTLHHQSITTHLSPHFLRDSLSL